MIQKSILYIILLLLGVSTCFSQKAMFIGINPSVTIEPYYKKGEKDINVFPVVFTKTLTSRIDVRFSTIVNLGYRVNTKKISHVGFQLAFPIYLKNKQLSEPSKGFYFAPGIGFTRNNLEKHSNLGFYVEPGYQLLINEKWSISFGMQLGTTHFNYDTGNDKWDKHFGLKIVLGRWF